MDMKVKTDQQIQNLIDNHRRAGKLDAPLAVAAIEERNRRNKSFDFEAGIVFLERAARNGQAVNYRQLAEAGGVLGPDDTWHRHMVRKIPLSDITLDARRKGQPTLTALVETKQGVTESVLSGFQKGLDYAGIDVPVGMCIRDFYFSERRRVFDWAATQ